MQIAAGAMDQHDGRALALVEHMQLDAINFDECTGRRPFGFNLVNDDPALDKESTNDDRSQDRNNFQGRQHVRILISRLST